jgi:hypothetical protein
VRYVRRALVAERAPTGQYERVRVRRALGCCALLVGVASACSSAHATGQLRDVSNPKACDVVPASETRTVIGSPVVADGGMHLPAWDCLYTATHLDASTHLPDSASVTLQHAARAYLARAFERRRTGDVRVVPKNAPKPPPPKVVVGVGDEALWDGQTLQVRSGQWLLGVVVKMGDVADLSRSTALAKLGLRQLPNA